MVELFRSPRRLLLFCFELALVAIIVFVASIIRELDLHKGLTQPNVAKKALLMAVVMGGAFYYSGLYDLGGTRTPRAVFSRVLRGVFLGAVILWVIFYFIGSEPVKIEGHIVQKPFFGRGVFFVSLAMTTLAIPLWRIAYNQVSEGQSFLRKTIILGNGPLAKELAEMILGRPHLGLDLVGMLGRDRNQVDPEQGVIGVYKDLYEICNVEDIAVVLVAYPDRRGTLPVEQLLEVKFRGVEVEEGVNFFERETGKIFVRELKPSQLIFSEGFTARPTTRRLKRILDLICATIGLVLAAPLMALTMLLIKLESPGPVLYKQVRAGEFGKLFTILKFRSMRSDAEKHGAQFAQKNDPRVTRVGKFIRKTRLDELPQLWNVLRGDMSMVGPRPERPVFIEQLEQQVPYFKQRLYVKPGVTGHAQVRCEYGASAEDMLEKLQYDLYYIKSYSVLFDLSIMLDTVKVVLFRIGAR